MIAREPAELGAAAYQDLIAQFVDIGRAVIAQLLDAHDDDGTGHCKTCTAGPQAGHMAFPCRLYELATEAQRLGQGGPR